MSLENVREFFPLAENRLSAIFGQACRGGRPVGRLSIDRCPPRHRRLPRQRPALEVDAICPAQDRDRTQLRDHGHARIRGGLGAGDSRTVSSSRQRNLPYYPALPEGRRKPHRTTLIRPLVLTQAAHGRVDRLRRIGIGLAGLITLAGACTRLPSSRMPVSLAAFADGRCCPCFCASAWGSRRQHSRRVLRVDPVILFQ